jgi:PAS domain S-box-containing protein
LLICGLVAAVIVGFAVAAYREVRRSAEATAHARLENVTRELSDVLGGAAERMRLQVTQVAGADAVRAYLRSPAPGTEETALRALRELALQEPGARRGELRSARGEFLAGTGDDAPAELPSASVELAGLLADGEDSAIGPLRAGGDRLFHLVVSRVDVGGRTTGHVVVWRSMGPADPREGNALRELIGGGARFYLANAGGDLWTDLGSAVEAPPLDLARMERVVAFDEPGTGTWLAAAVPVRGTPWTTVIAFPRAPIMAPALKTLGRLGLLGLLLLLLAAASAWVLSARLTGPIAKLSDAAAGISAGDYSRRVEIDRRDELGTLGKAFNLMGESVGDALAQLEDKVRQLAKSEEARQAAQARLEHAVTSSGAVIRVLRPEGDRLVTDWISENVTRILGYEVAEASEPGWWRRSLHPEDRDGHAGRPPLAEVHEGAREYRLRHANGAYRWLREDQRVLRDARGRPDELIAAWLDITEHRLLQEQFRQAQKLEEVGRLAGGVAHDFNNLLSVILGEADIALVEGAADPSARRSLAQIQTAAERAALLTRRLLTFSRKQLVEPRPLDLNEVVTGLIDMLARLVGEDLEIGTRLAPDLGWVKADAGQVEQVLVNLVVNARDAMPEGGTLVLGTGNVELDESYERAHPAVAPGEYVMLSVSDTGTGMTDEVKAHLFEPFFTTKEPGKGTGLGLATCYAVAQQAGGHLGVYSELGVGTTVRLYLPRAEHLDEASRPRAQEPSSSGDETVLLVEDDPGVRAVATRILTGRGYRVLEADNGESALDVLARHLRSVDLLLTDVVMPKMGGRILAERARALRPELPVLFTSGYNDDVILQHRLLEHGVALLPKPFTPLSLSAKVREVLDAARAG